MFFVSKRSGGLHIKRKPFGRSSLLRGHAGRAKERKKTTKYRVRDLNSYETKPWKKTKKKKKNTTRISAPSIYFLRNGFKTANDHQSLGVCSADRETSVLYTSIIMHVYTYIYNIYTYTFRPPPLPRTFAWLTSRVALIEIFKTFPRIFGAMRLYASRRI